MKRMTTSQPSNAHFATLNESVALNRLQHINGAGRMKAAGGRKNMAQGGLVHSDDRDCKIGGGGSVSGFLNDGCSKGVAAEFNRRGW